MTEAAAAAPRVPSAHLVGRGTDRAVFDVDRGKLFAASDGLFEAIDQAMALADDGRVRLLMSAAGMLGPRHVEPPPTSVRVHSVSLAVSAKCNLGCTYCYADQGSFGGAPASMSFDVARATIDNLLAATPAGEEMRVTFLGGEPLANRATLKTATLHAVAGAAAKGVRTSFSLTTNATLLTEEDAGFLDEHGFAVTISIDGVGAAHDLLRPFRGGAGSYDRVVERARLLLDRRGRRCSVAARASVTPRNVDLRATLAEFVDIGFDSVQFSPVLSAPTQRGEMTGRDLSDMLAEMIACGGLFEERLQRGELLPFANVIGTLGRIHRRVRDEYPCGAGGSYVGASASGALYACHRFIDDEDARLGDLAGGVDPARQEKWLSERNVRSQAPCNTCWARHLCGGGCHYEVMHRGRPACDYIRGWLDYCLGFYLALAKDQPEKLETILRAPASSSA